MEKTVLLSTASIKQDMGNILKEIVDNQYALQPEFQRYGEKGYETSLRDAKSILDTLLVAIEFDSKIILFEYVNWVKTVFTNLKLPINTLENFLKITLSVLEKRFQKNTLDHHYHY